MSAETTLYAALNGAAGVNALVSGRIFPDARPQESALPAIVYRRTGTEIFSTIHGAIAATRATLEIVCLTLTRQQTEQLAGAAIAAVIAAKFVQTNRLGEFDPQADVMSTTVQLQFNE